MEQSVKTTRLRRDMGRGSCSFDASNRQAEASSCSWVLKIVRLVERLELEPHIVAAFAEPTKLSLS